MAEYVKLRLTAAKVGVSMAFLGLLAGIADKARAATPRGHAAASVASVPGVSSVVKLDKLYLKLSTSVQKVDTALQTVQHKLTNNYDTANKISGLYLKIKDANNDFVQTSVANEKWLTIGDASAEFLNKAATAFDSSKLGGLPASAYGQIASGALTVGDKSASQTLLQVPGTNGTIIVVCAPSSSGGPAGVVVTVHNGTSITVPAVQDQNGVLTQVSLAAGDTPLASLTGNGAHQLQLQTFPTTGFAQILTLTISSEPVGNNFDVVGQMLSGNAGG